MSSKPASKDEDRVVHYTSTNNWQHAVAARLDAINRSNEAEAQHAAFFRSQRHQDLIDQVYLILEGWFTDYAEIHINHRANRGKPFTAIKVQSPVWPRTSHARKVSQYLDPLRDLGVEIINSPNSGSMIYRLR